MERACALLEQKKLEASTSQSKLGKVFEMIEMGSVAEIREEV